ncbi:helix-turn-helix domain-containing protein [Clostridium culturomicium]|uniref:helix-turn-helix domain-containing protein n=1 Tax=Clostridium culturomicium TaxID=1499683 RepID=UPI000590C4AD|nr:helix-turn-helix domain-containing protein [Clostridium culturomicium]
MKRKAMEINKSRKKYRDYLDNKYTFTKVNNHLRNRILTEVGVYAWVVYEELLSRLNTKTGECFPSASSIAEKTGMSERAVFKYLDILREKKWIAWEQSKASGSKHKSNYYYFSYPSMEEKYTDEAVEEEVTDIKPASATPSAPPMNTSKLSLPKPPAGFRPTIRPSMNLPKPPAPPSMKKEETVVVQMPTTKKSGELTEGKRANLIKEMIKNITAVRPNVLSADQKSTWVNRAKQSMMNFNIVAKHANDMMDSVSRESYYDIMTDTRQEWIVAGLEQVPHIDLEAGKIVKVDNYINRNKKLKVAI